MRKYFSIMRTGAMFRESIPNMSSSRRPSGKRKASSTVLYPVSRKRNRVIAP